jgi:hypothetical protein
MNKAALAALITLPLFAIGTADAGKAGAKKDNVVWSADAIKWEPGPVEGTQVAKLWGDWMKGGPYGVLIKFKAGTMHPMHVHTQTLKTVIMAGTFVFHPEGGNEMRLGPGSYLLQAGGKNHVSGCSPDADCEFFMTSPDKFDMTNVGDDKK